MVVLCVSLQFILGFALAMLLNRSFRGRGFLRAASMIPWVVPGVLVGLIWRWMYDGNYGVINDILVRLGIFKQYFGFSGAAGLRVTLRHLHLCVAGYPVLYADDSCRAAKASRMNYMKLRPSTAHPLRKG